MKVNWDKIVNSCVVALCVCECDVYRVQLPALLMPQSVSICHFYA